MRSARLPGTSEETRPRRRTEQRCWDLALRHYDAILEKTLPLLPKSNPLAKLFFHASRELVLSEEWLGTNSAFVDETLRQHLPRKMKIELIGYKAADRGPHEQPEAGITVRLWNVLPKWK